MGEVSEMPEEYKAALRDLMKRKGRPVQFMEKRYDWEDDDQVTPYGWTDWTTLDHVENDCEWVVEPGVKLVERSYSQFTDTFHSNEDEIGINVSPVSCRCGRYTDQTLRYVGSLGDILQELFGPPAYRNEIEL